MNTLLKTFKINIGRWHKKPLGFRDIFCITIIIIGHFDLGYPVSRFRLNYYIDHIIFMIYDLVRIWSAYFSDTRYPFRSKPYQVPSIFWRWPFAYQSLVRYIHFVPYLFQTAFFL